MIQLLTQFILTDIFSLNTKKERHYFVRVRAAEGVLRSICLPFLPLSEKGLLDGRGTRHGSCWVWSVKEMGSKGWKGRLEQLGRSSMCGYDVRAPLGRWGMVGSTGSGVCAGTGGANRALAGVLVLWGQSAPEGQERGWRTPPAGHLAG